MTQITSDGRGPSLVMRTLVVGCSVVAVVVATLLACPSIASAKGVNPKPRPSALSSCGTAGIKNHVGFFFDTVAHPTYTFEGASAYIVVQTSTQCGSDSTKDNFSNAYAMIASGPGHVGWAQTGFRSRGAVRPSGLDSTIGQVLSPLVGIAPSPSVVKLE